MPVSPEYFYIRILIYLFADGSVLSTSDSFKVLGVISDWKLTFEKHIHITASSVSQIAGILHMSSRIFDVEAIMSNCFSSFFLPCLEYCTLVWSSAGDSHLTLLDRVVSSFKILLPILSVDLRHRQE